MTLFLAPQAMAGTKMQCLVLCTLVATAGHAVRLISGDQLIEKLNCELWIMKVVTVSRHEESTKAERWKPLAGNGPLSPAPLSTQ